MNIARLYYKIVCPSPSAFFKAAKRGSLELRSVTTQGEEMSLYIFFPQKRLFEEICAETHTEAELVSAGAAYLLPRMLKRRIGIAIGAAICAGFMLAAQNYVISVEVLTDDPQIRSEVKHMLAENGVKVGAYIPSIKCVNIERMLKQRAEGVSWAGITLTDCTVIVDITEEIPKAEQHTERMPSDLIATHDAVIESTELYNGELVKTIGSGVLRGEKLVSGTLIREEAKEIAGKTVTESTEKYVRSIGKIYGTYKESVTFEQPLIERKMIVSDEKTEKRYLRIFDAEIPLFISRPRGNYTEDEEYSALRIMDEQTPVGLKTVTYSKYGFENVIYSKKQAEKLAEEKMKIYEANFYKNCEIRKRDKHYECENGSVYLQVDYEIYGVISRESKFFIKKAKSTAF